MTPTKTRRLLAVLILGMLTGWSAGCCSSGGTKACTSPFGWLNDDPKVKEPSKTKSAENTNHDGDKARNTNDQTNR
jgi:hypothetical protein